MVLKINYASAAEMEQQLPGIGQKRAEVLVRLREQKGGIDQILFETVLGRTAEDELLDLIDFESHDRVSYHGSEREGAHATTPKTSSTYVKGEKKSTRDKPRSVSTSFTPRPIPLDQREWPRVPAWRPEVRLHPDTFGDLSRLPPLRRDDGRPSRHGAESTDQLLKKLLRREARSSSSETTEEEPGLSSKKQKELKSGDNRDRSTSHGRRSRSSSKNSRWRSRKDDQVNRRRGERSDSSRSSKPHRKKQRSSRSRSGSSSKHQSQKKVSAPHSRSSRHQNSHRHSSRASSRHRSREGSVSRSKHHVKSHRRVKKSPARHMYRRREHSSSGSSSGERYVRDRVSQHRSSHTRGKSKSVFYFDSSDSDSSGQDEHYHSHHRGDPRKILKNLRYDGTSNWLSFKQKFDSYRTVMHWSEGECRDYLGWSLEGRALDFFTLTTQIGRYYSFRYIMKKLEMRFGAKELPETSKAKFHQAAQYPDEPLNEWADRVLSLATPAFRDLPDKYCRLEAISKFCQGCADKEAGKHACLEHPRSMEDALDMVKHFQYITQAVDGRKRRSKDDIVINALGAISEADVKRMIEDALSSITKKLDHTSLDDKTEKTPSGSACFFCKQTGHFKRDCQRYKSWLQRKEGKGQQNGQNLNGKGPGAMAEPLSRSK